MAGESRRVPALGRPCGGRATPRAARPGDSAPFGFSALLALIQRFLSAQLRDLRVPVVCVPRALRALALSLLVTTPALAQGRVTGTVKDADDHPIKGATITAENPNAAPSSFTATSDAKGRFGFLGLRSGLWTFTVRAPGYEAARTQSSTRMNGVNAPVQIVLQQLPQVAPPGPLATVDVAALQRRLDEAAALETAGNVDQAIQIYRDIATDLPALTTVHLQLGLLYERKQDVTAATSEYQAVLKTDPGNTKARAALDRFVRQ
jgi:Carboxypeptidase regulatory-like domain